MTNTLGGSSDDDYERRRPGGEPRRAGGAARARAGLVLSTNGGGPLPEKLDPVLTGTLQYEARGDRSCNTAVQRRPARS